MQCLAYGKNEESCSKCQFAVFYISYISISFIPMYLPTQKSARNTLCYLQKTSFMTLIARRKCSFPDSLGSRCIAHNQTNAPGLYQTLWIIFCSNSVSISYLHLGQRIVPSCPPSTIPNIFNRQLATESVCNQFVLLPDPTYSVSQQFQASSWN